jgi:MGT family glycosyltransferase
MNILIASTPASGHIDPMFSLARILVGAGHQVAGLSATAFRARIEAAGGQFFPFPDRANFDLRDISIAFPAYKTISPGLEMSRFYLEKVFIDAIPAQVEGLREALRVFDADVILGDDFFLGALPILLGPRSERPAVVLCGTTFLHYRRDDGAPNFVGLPPATSPAELEAYSAIAKEHEELLYAPTRRYFNDCLGGLGVRPLEINPLEAVITLPDAYLQLTVPSFEFPRRNLPSSVRFVGTPPLVPGQASVPEWASDLDGSRKVVLVTQGTISNLDLDQLIAPTMAALAKEPDLLVVVTGGGRSSSALPGPIPDNVRFASYLPFEWLLPKTDLLVTNGGYGSLNQALSFGIPIVAAGLSEDKADVNARVAWSGVGIDLKTQQPGESAIHQAVRRVLDLPNYRERTLAISEEFARLKGRARILSILERVSTGSAIQSDEPAPIDFRRYSAWVE